MAGNERRWTLDELAARVATALAEGSYEGAPNARVREVPDERVIRYYTTLGLVDRPSYEGRTAIYGVRHLRQIVAIKRLQSEGLSLSQVQERLAGIAPAALARLARVPSAAEAEEAVAAPKQDRARFWAAPPAAAPAASRAPAVSLGTASAAGSLVGVPLAEGVTLLLGLARPLAAEDVEALKEAAGPLVETLEKRGIIRRGEGR